MKVKKEGNINMAIGIGFDNDEKSIEDYYEEELNDAPIGAGGFVRDVCYEKAIERYLADKKDKTSQSREQGFV
jgi:hypothetical protein